MLASFRLASYIVLTSSSKDETAVHGYGPSLLVLVVLVSRKVHFLYLFNISCSIIVTDLSFTNTAVPR